VDQSFVENFPAVLNEENISQETSLLNIDPRLIRIDRESLRGAQQAPTWDREAPGSAARRAAPAWAELAGPPDPSSRG
jgi:hypothetical protein